MVSVGYLRVSSRSQDAASQRAAIARVASARGDTISVWYSDRESGRTLRRPELDRVRERARLGELGRLYVYRLDRLTRSGIRDTLSVLSELRQHGCEVVSIADGFALHGPVGDVVVAVIAWAADMERRAIGERIASARERVEAQGGRWGRPRRLDAADIDRARAMRAEGRTWRSIAMAMRCPKTTILRALEVHREPKQHVRQ